MKKIIVSNNSLLRPLYANIINDANYQISELTELKCIDAINSGDFDLALVSPLIYSVISKKNDERIIASNVLVLEDFSGELTLNIAPKKDKLLTIFFEEINEFIIVAAKLLLSERYGIEPQLVNNAGDADIILTMGNEKYADYIKLDLTEDWFDTFEVPLVLGFWIVSNEKFRTDTVEQINDFFDKNILDKNIIEIEKTQANSNDVDNENDFGERVGYRYWNWDSRFVAALDKTFDLLFYRNFASHIADVKMQPDG
jgi:hypothetical protein